MTDIAIEAAVREFADAVETIVTGREKAAWEAGRDAAIAEIHRHGQRLGVWADHLADRLAALQYPSKTEG